MEVLFYFVCFGIHIITCSILHGTRLFINGCRIRTADFVCADGVVHTIDCVLQPNFRNEPDKWFGDTS